MKRILPFLLGVTLACFASTTVGCAGDEELQDSKGGNTDPDAVVLEAAPPDTYVAPPDTTVDAVVDSSVPDADLPEVEDSSPVDTSMPEVGCTSATECPGSDTECKKRACNSGVCAWSYTAAGTPSATQIPNDCKRIQCDGKGELTIVVDSLDKANDNNECTTDVCSGAVPTYTPTPAGSTCTKGGTMCNGTGRCVQCITAASCPGTDTACSVRTCLDGTCGTMNIGDGAVTSMQIPRDCKQQQCDGMGSTKNVPLDTDLPVDGNACTKDVCTAGTPSNPPEAASTPCATGYCNGSGSCVQCVLATHCPAPPICRTRVCSASNTCTTGFVGSGTACTGGVCNGSGSCVQCVSPANCPAPPVCYTATCVGNTCGTTYNGNNTYCPLPGGVSGWCYLPSSGPAQCYYPIG